MSEPKKFARFFDKLEWNSVGLLLGQNGEGGTVCANPAFPLDRPRGDHQGRVRRPGVAVRAVGRRACDMCQEAVTSAAGGGRRRVCRRHQCNFL
eukprot:80154-Hanusia_phi.AAC.3